MQVKFDFINNILLINKKLGFYPFYFFKHLSLLTSHKKRTGRQLRPTAENTASPQATPSIKTTDSKNGWEKYPFPVKSA